MMSQFIYLFLYFAEHLSILWDHFLCLFWNFGDVCTVFQIQGGSLTCMLGGLQAIRPKFPENFMKIKKLGPGVVQNGCI